MPGRSLRLWLWGLFATVMADPAMAQTAGARQWLTPAVGDVARGQALYPRCTACHAVDSNKIGPPHCGVIGRRVGSHKRYKYTDEMAQPRLRWTPQILGTWLQDPEYLVAGQRMGFQVDGVQERADLIAWLATRR